jgi:class 3 adenylate cyclase
MPESIVIRSMLFADVVGFSKLPDTAYPAYMSGFLAESSRLLNTHRVLASNTWGDAIFAVFEHPAEAAGAALALQKLVRAQAGSLRLRIGLHAGPVHEGYDPITKGRNFLGRHINVAARIEPIAEEGHVYVSGEFAALATVAGGEQFQFDYVGQRQLPKKAGLIPIFRLLETSAG